MKVGIRPTCICGIGHTKSKGWNWSQKNVALELAIEQCGIGPKKIVTISTTTLCPSTQMQIKLGNALVP